MLKIELLVQLKLQRFPSIIVLDLILLQVEETKVLVLPQSEATSGTMDILSRVEAGAVICSFRPLGMCHSRLRKIQPGKKFLAVNNGETFSFSRLGVGLKGWQVGTIDRNVVECIV